MLRMTNNDIIYVQYNNFPPQMPDVQPEAVSLHYDEYKPYHSIVIADRRIETHNSPYKNRCKQWKG